MTYTTRTIGRDLPNGDYVEITAVERDDSGTLSPGFSITLSGWEKRGTWSGRAAKRNGREMVYAGADHETILAAAPELAPIVHVHLSAPDGTPMHAVANGWYFYSGAAAKWDAESGYGNREGLSDHDRGARSLNIPPADLPAGLDKEGFAAFAATLAGRWQADADAARACLLAMVDGEGVER